MSFASSWGRQARLKPRYRVTTVLPKQGQYACAADGPTVTPPPDLTVERVGDLLGFDLSALVGAGRPCDGAPYSPRHAL